MLQARRGSWGTEGSESEVLPRSGAADGMPSSRGNNFRLRAGTSSAEFTNDLTSDVQPSFNDQNLAATLKKMSIKKHRI